MPHPWHSLRWALRRRFRRIRRDSRIVPADARDVLYAFAGTYGDFAQILRPLQALAAACPGARIRVLAPEKMLAAFASFLPDTARGVGWAGALILCLRGGADLFLCNAVGVFRVRFDLLACFGGRISLGFRHGEEKSRPAYSGTLPLTPALRSFESANLALLRLAGIALPRSPGPSSANGKAQENGKPKSDRVLFHVGSAGLRRAFGDERYLELISALLKALPDRVGEILYGPGDQVIAERLRFRHPELLYACPALPELAAKLKAHAGPVLCFNSFFAHFCRFLEVPAWVVHRETVPYGYDCDPPHFQFVLPAEGPWDFEPLLQEAMAVKTP
jgi:hypothetical protein